jgi:hypothetical protein
MNMLERSKLKAVRKVKIKKILADHPDNLEDFISSKNKYLCNNTELMSL